MMDYDKLANELGGKSKESEFDYDAIANEVTQQDQPASFMERLGTGVIDPVVGLNQLMYNALPDVGQRGVDFVTNKAAQYGIGTPMPESGYNEFVQQREEAIEQESPKGVNWARALGNVASPVNFLPAASGTRAAATSGGRMFQGMGLGAFGGATEPIKESNYERELAKNTALGATLGYGGSGVVEGISRVISPSASINPAVQSMKENIDLTPGQALGGFFNTTEQKLQSVPAAGDMITARRKDALSQFNKSLFNKAGKSIGFKTDKTGIDALSDLDAAVNQAYKNAIEKTNGVSIDDEFIDNVLFLSEMAQDVADSGEVSRALNRQIETILGKVSESNRILPETWKELDSVIGKLASKGESQDFKDAMRQLQKEWRGAASRSNPEQAELFRSADKAYSGLELLTKATFRSASDQGEFTPAQMFGVARQLAPTKASLRQQTALFLRESMDAQDIIGSTVPNSGTVDRALTAGGLGALAMIEPSTLIAPAIGSAMYTKPISRALTYGITNRPKGAQSLAEAIRAASPVSGLAASRLNE